MTHISLNDAREKLLHNDGFFYTLLRSGISAQICGWIDMLVSFMLFALIHLTPWLSTAIGAFTGGIFNCIINYRYAFHAHNKNVSRRAVTVKFLLVWTASLLLNSFGTQILYYNVRSWEWLREFTGMSNDAIFLAARLSVSLVVSLGWNFLLQRCFVFRTTRFDNRIIRAWESLASLCKTNRDGKKTER